MPRSGATSGSETFTVTRTLRPPRGRYLQTRRICRISGMKTTLAALSVLCLSLSACSKDADPPTQKTGAVGQGLGGQTVGTPFAGSSGAGSTKSAGPGTGSNASSSPTGQ